ncbi:MAG: Fur family transcriptional regulator [Candidatus Dormiibacterota bacterium]
MPLEVRVSPNERIRVSGERVTALRVAILDLLQELGHASAEQLAHASRARLGSISLQAVYDSLGVLGQAGLVRRIEPAGSPALFEMRVADNHHHLVCRSCRGVTDVDCAVGHAPCLAPISDYGYQIDEAEVTYWGICPKCQAVPVGASGPAVGK